MKHSEAVRIRIKVACVLQDVIDNDDQQQELSVVVQPLLAEEQESGVLGRHDAVLILVRRMNDLLKFLKFPTFEIQDLAFVISQDPAESPRTSKSNKK